MISDRRLNIADTYHSKYIMQVLQIEALLYSFQDLLEYYVPRP